LVGWQKGLAMNFIHENFFELQIVSKQARIKSNSISISKSTLSKAFASETPLQLEIYNGYIIIREILTTTH